MTREEARKAADVMLAYANGEEIERLREDGYEWVEDNFNPLFNWFANEYRIKPKPIYRPFKTKEECWKEMMKHQPFGWVKYKSNGNNTLIGNVYTDIYTNKEVAIAFSNRSKFYSASEVFNNYVFTDGTPFGIKKE